MFREAGRDCPLCPRLAEFRQANRQIYPTFHNAPVPAFGALDAPLLIVGLAPGLKGANQTGRPFTNDYAGDLLYPTLLKMGLAKGTYDRRADDGLALVNTRITNAVRCVPPQNKPIPAEEKTCRTHFLIPEIAAMKNLKAVLALGGLSHGSVLKLFGRKLSQFKFAHGAQHQISDSVTLFDSYHCSRYNTNTGVLTTAMFEDVVRAVAQAL
jgi:uracil-DNA glycosylase family 4